MYRFLAILLILFTFVSAPAYARRMEGIAAVVNDEVISYSDVSDRIKLVISSSGMPDTADMQDRLRPQIVHALIDEVLRVQEARRLSLDISPQEIEEAIGAIGGQNKMTGQQFKEMLEARGINLKTLKDQIRAQIAWSKVVNWKIKPEVKVTETDVDALLRRLEANIGKDQYHVAEILLPLTKGTKESDIAALAQKLHAEISATPSSFKKVATQFSKSATAAQGGDIGWVTEDQLAAEVADTVSKMGVGKISQPVKSLSGYHILKLIDKRKIEDKNIPSIHQLHQNISMEQLERKQRGYFLDIRSSAFIEIRD